jgi:hypothetical protein
MPVRNTLRNESNPFIILYHNVLRGFILNYNTVESSLRDFQHKCQGTNGVNYLITYKISVTRTSGIHVFLKKKYKEKKHH